MRHRLRKSDRPKGTNKAVYVRGTPKAKFLGRKSEADLKRIGIKKGGK